MIIVLKTIGTLVGTICLVWILTTIWAKLW